MEKIRKVTHSKGHNGRLNDFHIKYCRIGIFPFGMFALNENFKSHTLGFMVVCWFLPIFEKMAVEHVRTI